MSTQKTTTNTNQYDSASKTTYDSMQSGIGNSLNGLMNAGSKYVPLWMQQANQNIGTIGNRMNSNLLANAQTNGGFGGGSMPAFMQAGLARNSRALGGMQSNAFLNSQFQGLQLQQQGTQMAMGYQPLQTGQTSVQKTSGTGTWLPQVLGAAAQIGMGVATGGASTAMRAFGNLGAGQISGAFGGPTSVATEIGGNPYLQSTWNPSIGG